MRLQIFLTFSLSFGVFEAHSLTKNFLIKKGALKWDLYSGVNSRMGFLRQQIEKKNNTER